MTAWSGKHLLNIFAFVKETFKKQQKKQQQLEIIPEFNKKQKVESDRNLKTNMIFGDLKIQYISKHLFFFQGHTTEKFP